MRRKRIKTTPKKFSSEPNLIDLRNKVNDIANFYENTEDQKYFSFKTMKNTALNEAVLIVVKNLPIKDQTEFVVKGYIDHYVRNMFLKYKTKEGNKIVTKRIPVKRVVYL
jgi:lipid II:glycine glycyltransferase (peptidoglycan interpeptide bridge formation enzyme)